MQETGFDPRVGKIPWRREWLPTPLFLPGKFHGQRSLVGYSPRVAESDTTKQLTLSLSFFNMEKKNFFLFHFQYLNSYTKIQQF